MLKKADIISIGDEILIGQIVNTNAAWISTRLNELGIGINRVTSVGDSHEEILAILDEASKRSDIIIITGGLDPTSDDITKPALCSYFNTRLVHNEIVYAHLETFIKQRGSIMNEGNKSQAMLPECCEVLQNNWGTAPGMWFEKQGIIYVSLPGVPFEMEGLMNEYVLPKLQAKFGIEHIIHRTILTHGIAEAQLATILTDWEKTKNENVKLAYLPSPGMVKLRLSVYGEKNGSALIQQEEKKLHEIIGNAIYGYDEDTFESVIGKLLKERNSTLSLAESCTGGTIASKIVSISGSSDYFKGGIVAYSNEIKMKELGVPAETLVKHGAVSQQTAEAMAEGV
ncbi:MAG TPA: CinA family nicotinamide mononucleotide deamidase-related protein, partial [Bacteroidales bacterium]